MNTIAQRINDFLKQYPPFESLNKAQLLEVSKAVKVVYLESGKMVFDIDQSIPDEFYVVNEGAIGLYNDKNQLIDECDEGDIFGLRALLRQGTYVLKAEAIEESILYSISASVWKEYIASNSEASQFLLSSFASNTRVINDDSVGQIEGLSEMQSATYSKSPITCSSELKIKEAALVMTSNRVGSIVITNDSKPIGIVTDKDFRTKVATGDVSIDSMVSEIMSSPVITVSEKITVAEAQIAMLRNQITHLCVTKDGSPQSSLTGILSEHDIIVLRENNASSIIKEIKRSNTSESLKLIRQNAEKMMQRYLDQQAPITFVSRLMSAINDAITNRIIQIVISELGPPPCKFSWLAIGSQGRQEQLLMTDQDNALVYELDDSENLVEKDFFLKMSAKINSELATVGFELCPAQMMASNPEWCLSLSEWKKKFKKWITSPDQENLMLCTIFFDFELVYGNKELVFNLSESIFLDINKHDIFLNYLGRNALQNPPPLSFFRQFLVEESGEHKDQFDIKARAMMPLVDAARLLIFSHEVMGINNTLERYNKLIDLEPENKDTFQFCLDSFKDLLEFRTTQGLANKDSGRFIDLKSLNKGNRLKLKRSFKAVKMIQELIKTRYRLAQLM